tara:strand:- start:220535 stop:226075 length:5541 start_codon:yes stop_codon:yes gene_type:complete
MRKHTVNPLAMKTTKFLHYALLFLFFLACSKSKKDANNIYQFKDYINYTTSGVVSVREKVSVNLSKDIEGLMENESVPSGAISIKPAVDGEFEFVNNHSFNFIPNERLQPDTEYTVSIRLDKFYKDIPDALGEYTFQFKTIKPNFSIQTKVLQSYSKDWQFIEGVVKSADIISLEEAQKLVTATQNESAKNIVWDDSNAQGKYFDFKIDSIQRFVEDSKLVVSWNGNAIDSNNKGENEIAIPGKDNFKIVDIKAIKGTSKYISINFSDALKPQQNFDGLVGVKGFKDLNFVVNGNELKVYSNGNFSGTRDVTVFQGIRNTDDFKLKRDNTFSLTFEPLKPEIRAISSGTILPNSSGLKYNFEAINVKEVNIRVIKIFEDNVLQFLQDNNLNSDYDNAIKQVGRTIAKEKMTLVKDPENYQENWKAYAIDLANMIDIDPGSIYRVELSFTKDQVLYKCAGSAKSANGNDPFLDNENEELYWDNKLYYYKNYTYNWRERNNPCHDAYYNSDREITQNILASNLGVIAKQGTNNNYFFAVTDIINTNPISGAEVTIYNYQQQEILSEKTDSNGMLKIESPKNAAFAIVSKGENKAYLRLVDGNALSLSKFDVSGKRLQKGLKGYLYGERGVWRPGDDIHLTFLLNDAENKLPEDHPVKLEVTDPRGKLVFREVTSENVNRFYKFTIGTNDDYATGNYSAKVSVGGAKFYKNLKVETVKPNRLKMKIDFGEALLSKNEPIKGDLQVNWLHGTPAKNLKAEIKAKISATSTSFKNFKDYKFTDPSRDFYAQELNVFEGKLDQNGKAKISKSLKVGKNAPGMLNIQFLVRAFETGGDFSIDAFSKKYAPYDVFVGLKSPEGNRYGSFYTDENQSFSVVSIDKDGKPVGNQELEVQIYQIHWRWWWSSGSDNLSRYTSSRYKKRYKTLKINTNENGRASFDLNIPDEDRGRFLIRVLDKKGGHATGRTAYFYKNWWQNEGSADKEAAKMLVFSADKEKYNVGETAKITFPSGSQGRALISIENGTDVIESVWVTTQKGFTTAEIPITKAMTPNVYATISLLQPHQVSENDLPLRLYGTIPILVEDKNTILEPVINMPAELKPEKSFTVKVSEKNNKAMTYTLAVVEEGLLDLTRFKTPNAYKSFYAREALGVKTWDVFDDVIGAYAGSIDQVYAIGGDGSVEKGKNKKANRFKPVVKFLGPFTLEKGTTKEHKITLPNYIGAVRTMVVAGDVNKEAYGSQEKSTPVKKPLMVLATLPRKLSPTEKVTLPISVFAMDKKVKDVSVQVKTTDGLKVLNQSKKSISFTKPDEKMIYFDLEVTEAKGIHKVEVIASGNGEQSSYEVELDVVNPNNVTTRVMDVEIQKNASQNANFETFGVQGSNKVMVEFSTIPSINFTERLAYLIQYPHGCVEQTTSSVFPQLFMADIFDLDASKKMEIQKNIEKGIARLGNFQLPSGGLSYWMGESYVSDWGTSYAGHFMLEAEKKGFVLPLTFKTNFINYQKDKARNWRQNYNGYTSDLEQAYRLYTLALAGSPDLSSMNRLREFKKLSNDAKWRLAAAYALAGQNEVTQELVRKADLNFNNSNWRDSYGSETRNRAMALETMLLTNDEKIREVSKQIAKTLSSKKWMSTQTTAYALMAIGKMVVKNGGKSMDLSYAVNNKTMKVKTESSMVQRELDILQGSNALTITNNGNNLVFARIINSGKLPVGQEAVERRGLSVKVRYVDLQGKPVDVRRLKQGQDFKAEVFVSNPKNTTINDIALTQIFPSGWEIVNTRFTDFGSTATSTARYTDIKDDRVNYYFDLKRSNRAKTKKFTVLLNAAYLGKYYLPGAQVEAMYDNDYFVRTSGNWVEIIK